VYSKGEHQGWKLRNLVLEALNIGHRKAPSNDRALEQTRNAIDHGRVFWLKYQRGNIPFMGPSSANPNAKRSYRFSTKDSLGECYNNLVEQAGYGRVDMKPVYVLMIQMVLATPSFKKTKFIMDDGKVTTTGHQALISYVEIMSNYKAWVRDDATFNNTIDFLHNVRVMQDIANGNKLPRVVSTAPCFRSKGRLA
jgi:hypothetical protein